MGHAGAELPAVSTPPSLGHDTQVDVLRILTSRARPPRLRDKEK